MIQTEAKTVRVERSGVGSREAVSALLVLGLTLAALLAGWMLRDSVEGRMRSYSDQSGLSLRYPAAWQIDTSGAQQGQVQVSDSAAGRHPTTYAVRSITVDASAPVTEVLGLVSDSLAAERGRDLTAYKVFSVSAGQTIKGLPAATTRYVFVNTPSGVFRDFVPAVVLGEDYLVHRGDKVYVFSLHAMEDNFAEAQAGFNSFVESAQLP